MGWRYLAAVTAGVTVVACSVARPPGAQSSPETRTALGTAGVVAQDVPYDSRTFRVRPLDSMRSDVEILLGHPDSAGRPFVMRIRELPGTVIPPHLHPVDENLTVVSGTLHFGTGDGFDSSAVRALRPGSYVFIPAGTTMFGYVTDEAVVQVHGTGPFHIVWRHGAKVLDEPNAAESFRFRIGDNVVTPRGPGRIRQGYASGPIIQYEIEGENGVRFMAHQRQISRR